MSSCHKEGELDTTVPKLDLDWKDEKDETPAPEKMGKHARNLVRWGF